MKKFVVGFIVGTIIGNIGLSYASLVIGDGYLHGGWSVTKDGEEICTDPYVYESSREIECD